jgi:hypothetical protein
VHGSTFAFHGSPPENWHSIFRNGLLIREEVLHGSAYGKGVYLACAANTSFGYSQIDGGGGAGGMQQPPLRRQQSGNRYLDSSSLRMIAICEVIKDKSAVDRVGENTYCWVAKDDAMVMTRFFFVYCDDDAESVGHAMQLNTTNSTFTDEIRACMHANGL